MIAGAGDRLDTGTALALRSGDGEESGRADAEEDSVEDCAARRGVALGVSTGGVPFMEERRQGGLDSFTVAPAPG